MSTMSNPEEADTLAPELPAMFDGMKLAAVATMLYIVIRCLNLKSKTEAPQVTCQDTVLSRYLLKSCPLLTKEWASPLAPPTWLINEGSHLEQRSWPLCNKTVRVKKNEKAEGKIQETCWSNQPILSKWPSVFLLRYVPPLLWGKSGHLQTALYGKMGRINTPTPRGVRKFLPMPDGATATFDLFEALREHRTGGKPPTRVMRCNKDWLLSWDVSVSLAKVHLNPRAGSLGWATFLCCVMKFHHLTSQNHYVILIWRLSPSSSPDGSWSTDFLNQEQSQLELNRRFPDPGSCYRKMICGDANGC